MLALRTRFDARQLVLDRVLNGLVVAKLEMQERVVLDRPPVTAEQRFRAAEIDRARLPVCTISGRINDSEGRVGDNLSRIARSRSLSERNLLNLVR